MKKKRILIQSLFHNQGIPFNIRFVVFQELVTMKKNSSKTRYENRCIFSGRARSVYKLFRLSRIQIKEMACTNILPGLKQSNW